MFHLGIYDIIYLQLYTAISASPILPSARQPRLAGWRLRRVGRTQDYEKSQLLECLHKAVQDLTKKEHQLIQYLYYDDLSERETAAILKISQPAVKKRRDKIIQKLRNSLIDWL